MTTRGFKEEEARMTAHRIADVLDNPRDSANIEAVRAKVHALTSRSGLRLSGMSVSVTTLIAGCAGGTWAAGLNQFL